MNRRQKLTDALIRRLKSGPREYTVRDTVVPSLGIRVHPSGGRSYIHFCEGRKVSLGPAALKTVEEARAESRVQLSDGVPEKKNTPLFGNFVSGPWRDSWVHRCKPSTVRWRDRLLETRLLPEFGELRLDRITRTMVHQWFDSYSGTAPGNANQCLHTLRHIFNHAVACGVVPSNPAGGIKLNPGRRITRFLSREELGRLHRVLGRRERSTTARASQRQQIDIIRLLLLTGCRKNEIVRLHRDEVAESCLRLRDSKTGPRTVFLNAEAWAIIERRMAGGTRFLFPSPKDVRRPLGKMLNHWYSIRKEAGLDDVRLHDLRHTYASHAVMQGTPLPVVARLLGHSQTTMTLRYAHTGDRETEAAAERIGKMISEMLGIGDSRQYVAQ
ncbi:MAG: tyrosine-type recombinase/integrase [bacterium]|nr:tyrosine-type recombinase/integrase [bacterium]